MSAEVQTLERPELVLGKKDRKTITEMVAKPLDRLPSKNWFLMFSITSTLMMLGFLCIGWTFYKGIGVWGNNQPVGWAFDITNFVFWIGIGHAGTLISAILFLFRQR